MNELYEQLLIAFKRKDVYALAMLGLRCYEHGQQGIELAKAILETLNDICNGRVNYDIDIHSDGSFIRQYKSASGCKQNCTNRVI